MSDSIRIVRGSVEEATDAALSVLSQTRSAEGVDRAHGSWLYEKNPDGAAELWTAVDEESGATVGFAALVPRRMWVLGEERRCWNAVHLSVVPEYRRRGIATRLRVAARERVDAGEVDFLYGHPNTEGEGAHRKAGYTSLGQMLRYDLVLRSEPTLRRAFRSKRVSETAALFADPLLRFKNRELRKKSAHVRCRVVDDASSAFDELDRNCLHNVPIIGVRDAAYIHWRYVDKPGVSYTLIVAERGKQMAGFAVLKDRGELGDLIDVYPPTDPEVVDALLREAVNISVSRGYQRLRARLLEHNPCIDNLTRFGFKERGVSRPMYAYSASGLAWSDAAGRGSSWYVWEGDRGG